jgi:hypothetical protein
MKHFLLIAVLALCTGVARAQLDHILEPIAEAPDNSTLGDSGNVDMAAVAAGGTLTPKTVRTLSADDLQSELQKQLTAYFGRFAALLRRAMAPRSVAGQGLRHHADGLSG